MLKTGSGNKFLANSASALACMRFLELKYFQDYLGEDYIPSMLAFSETCKAARDILSDFRKKQFLKSLLTAVVCGNEDLARKIITSHPELLLDSSAIATDLSGKEIKNLTPPEALICAGDVDMLLMIKQVLQHKLQVGITLSFNPELEIQRQIASIYPNGDINAKEAEQMATAQEFKTSTLRDIFTAINAATPALVKFELDTPGQHTGSPLNAALHSFRAQFAKTANSEQIFNPFYLLKAFEFYDEQFYNFNGNAGSADRWNRRSIFWCQIIGYIQRHLPACYLQAFAQGLYDLVENNKKLERNFKFTYGEGDMRAIGGDVNNLGYKWSAARGAEYGPYPAPSLFPSPAQFAGWVQWERCARLGLTRAFKNYCEQKNQAWRTYAAESQWQQLQSYLPTRCVIA